jgi:hypothetical protein
MLRDMNGTSGTMAELRRRRRLAVSEAARAQAGVISRSQLYAAGFSRGEVRANVRADRWRRLGAHCLHVRPGAMSQEATWWAAVLEGGPRAFLDGETALIAAGLTNFDSRTIRVSVPRGAKIRHRGTIADIRQTRRWSAEDVLEGAGPPRARPAVAAIRAALWARTHRQANLLLVMAVQQGLVRVEDLARELLRIRRDKRRALVAGVLLELAGGVRSLGELDVVRGCRERGIPEPDKQVLRRTSTGTYYLDFRWSRWAVALEVDGIQHNWVQQVVPDALRHNSIALSGDTVLRLPVLGLRLCPDDFFDQVAQALVNRGWTAPGPQVA